MTWGVARPGAAAVARRRLNEGLGRTVGNGASRAVSFPSLLVPLGQRDIHGTVVELDCE